MGAARRAIATPYSSVAEYEPGTLYTFSPDYAFGCNVNPPAPLRSFEPTQVLCRDIPRLKRLRENYSRNQAAKFRDEYDELLIASAAHREARDKRSFRFEYPADLPITPRKDEILEVLRKHQTLIVQGGTGSGKSTQIPKILLEGGFSAGGLIGCTQPRRIAALSIADRLRQETTLPDHIGAKIRFLEDCPPNTRIKVMTDGILLQEFRRDPLLYDYACLVLDEAHERSLNIDILLGICRNILPRRPEFRLVITSATLDAERFSEFFRNAPVIEVEGRQYPVHIEYWEGSGGNAQDSLAKPGVTGTGGQEDADEDAGSEREFSYLEAAALAIRQLQRGRPDNLLAFLPAEKDIHELHRELEKDLGASFSILPLYGRLTAGEQKRVYQTGGKPKIILATNIAETSLTIPGIAYVVDSGLARISRYHAHTRIQGLPIEKISQASAKQRTGRAGRVKPGICVRLFSEESFHSRAEYTEPEILRSNLANVLLQLKALRLPVESFPFLDEPPRNAFRGAYRQLHELGALSAAGPEGKLTQDGRELARLPLDVTLGKILVTAARYDVLQPAMVLAAGLTVQDPRYFPSDDPEKQKAVASHRRFDDPASDFMSLINLWNWLHETWSDHLSQRKLRNLCTSNYLNYRRVREWMDLFEQFARLYKITFAERRISGAGLDADAVHKAVVSGFLSFLAQRKPDEPFYRLQSAREAYPHPRSALARKKPPWIVASEVRQTSRVFLMRAAAVDPAWVEELAPVFCKRSYYNIAWNGDRGFVEALEKVTFRGFIIRQNKRVNYESIDPDACEEILWREGVLAKNIRGRFAFLAHNEAVLQDLEKLERKNRLRNLVPGEQSLIDFYRLRAPGVTSAPALNRFLEAHGETALQFSVADWTQVDTSELLTLFPDTLHIGKNTLPVGYLLDYDSSLDGLSLEILLTQLSLLSPNLLFNHFSGWRLWVLEYVLERMGKEVQDKLRGKEPTLAAEWLTLGNHKGSKAPILALAKVLQAHLPDWPQRLLLPVTWPSHLHIHVRISAPRTGRRFLLHIHPGMGKAAFFRQAFDAVYSVSTSAGFSDTRPAWHSALGEAPPLLAWEDEGVKMVLAPSPFPLALHGNKDRANWAAAFFADASEAAFYQAWAGLFMQFHDLPEGFSVYSEWLRGRLESLIEGVGYPSEMTREENQGRIKVITDALLPRLLQASGVFPAASRKEAMSFLQNQVPAMTVTLHAGKKAASFSDLRRLSSEQNLTSGQSWVWGQICLGAASLDWHLFIRLIRVVASLSQARESQANSCLDALTRIPNWEEMLMRPYWNARAAWVADAELRAAGVSPVDARIAPPVSSFPDFFGSKEPSNWVELGAAFQAAQSRENANSKWIRAFRGHFSRRLADLESPAALSPSLKKALEIIQNSEIRWSTKALAACDVEIGLSSMETGKAGIGKGQGNLVGTESPFKEKLLENLNKRFKKL